MKNPSTWPMRIAVCLIAAVAVVIATCLALYQWKLLAYIKDPVFGTGTMQVLDSQLSHEMRSWMRIPDASLGAIAYVGDIIFALAGSTQRWKDRPWLVMLFGVSVIPVGIVSILLVILQKTIVHHWCFYCFITATISLILIFLGYNEVKVSLIYLKRVWKRSKSFKAVWNTLWGNPPAIATKVAAEMEKGYVG